METAIQALAFERFRLIRPCLEEGVPLAVLARQASVTERTLDRKSTRQNSSHPLKSRMPSSA